MIRAIDLMFLLVVCTLLAGCETTGSTPRSVCDALVGPIKYTSENAKSARFAGPGLAPDLAVRNRVGVNLKCKAYR